MSVDLHLHTHHSDGSWSPAELVSNALRLRLTSIAITDHDTVAGVKEARLAATNSELEIITGIEINTVLPREDGTRKDIHILGYFFDPQHEAIQLVMRRQQAARQKLVDDMLAKAKDCGINLSLDDILDCAGNGSIGRPHITRAIVKVGGARNLSEAYERFCDRRSPDYVARHSITPQEAIVAIAAAGGISSIAHPGKSEDMQTIILQLQACGLNGIEAYHRSHGLKLVKRYLKLASQQKMLITGGSDCHGPSDGYPASIGSVRIAPDVVRNLKAAHLNSSHRNTSERSVN